MRTSLRTACLLSAILAGGCVPDRVVWSPNGQQAAILGDDGLHLCDASGKLSPLLVPNVHCVAWLPDSKRVVVCQHKDLETWPEVSQAFPKEAAAAEKNVNAVRAELQAATHGWQTFIEDTKRKLQLSDDQLALALVCLREQSHDSPPLLFQKDKAAFAALALHEDIAQLYTVTADSATAGPILYRHLLNHDGILSARVSPTSQAVLLSVDVGLSPEQQEPSQLLLAPIDGSEKICDLERGAWYPDWSPDGNYIVYIKPAEINGIAQKDSPIGILTRQRVTDDQGQFLNNRRWPAAEELAAMAFDSTIRLQVAKDGRIFFSALEISLPTAMKDIDGQPTIFCFDPGKQSTLTHVVPRGALQTMGNAGQYFELSPDARYLSMPFDDGRVSILDIATGEAQLVQPIAEGSKENGDKKLTTIPTWRSATELTFVRPIANSTAHEVVLYSVPDKKATVLSIKWPAEIGEWLAGKSSSPGSVEGH